ncbi:hypothetical protein SAMN02746065_11081 [Desulfocicer vacuolatum DSM 3385]|uniref:DUF1573 domain-containing protein n=1 Tax=Desulfocicer vacuolatum DSM 3385 TaxID=1121400 RepID=A0A1W2C2B4_9BACT|nr:hypothetical protein SAMN02746065_11081 [Desulfocicer vacuolatum DSM 3385]
MTLAVSTSGYGGKTLSKIIQVYTNDPDHKIISLKVSGAVEKMVNIQPKVVRLTGKVGGEITSTVKVLAMEKYPFTIKNISVKNKKTVAVELQPSEENAFAWNIKVTNKQTRPGRYFDMITLVTDSTIQPEIRINVFGNILE